MRSASGPDRAGPAGSMCLVTQWNKTRYSDMVGTSQVVNYF
jgi:hypothetical protein